MVDQETFYAKMSDYHKGKNIPAPTGVAPNAGMSSEQVSLSIRQFNLDVSRLVTFQVLPRPGRQGRSICARWTVQGIDIPVTLGI